MAQGERDDCVSLSLDTFQHEMVRGGGEEGGGGIPYYIVDEICMSMYIYLHYIYIYIYIYMERDREVMYSLFKMY